MIKKLKENIKEKIKKIKEKRDLKKVEKKKKQLNKEIKEKKLREELEKPLPPAEIPLEEPKEEIEEEKPKKGLVGQLAELNEKIDIISDKKKQEKKLKKKKFKIPFRVKSQLKKLAVKDKVQVILLQRTKGIKPLIGEIKDGMLLIGKDQIYNGSVDATWLWNGKIPTMIVPEWDLQPLTPEGIKEMKTTSTMSAQELHNYCIRFGRSAVPGKIIIRAVEAKANQMLTGSKASVKTIILVIVVTLIIAAVLFSGGVI